MSMSWSLAMPMHETTRKGLNQTSIHAEI